MGLFLFVRYIFCHQSYNMVFSFGMWFSTKWQVWWKKVLRVGWDHIQIDIFIVVQLQDHYKSWEQRNRPKLCFTIPRKGQKHKKNHMQGKPAYHSCEWKNKRLLKSWMSRTETHGRGLVWIFQRWAPPMSLTWHCSILPFSHAAW